MLIKMFNCLRKIKKIIFSIDVLKITIPVLITILGWLYNEHNKIQWEQYKRKEESYKELIRSTRGFYSSSSDSNLRQQFIEELDICWLYAPDNVIEKGYAFLETVQVGANTTSEEKKEALGDFMLAIRKNIFSREIDNDTNLDSSDFRTLVPVGE